MGGPGVSGRARRPYLPSMGQTGHDRRPADPFSMLTQGMRQMGSLDLGEVRQGLAYFTNPDASFLDMLGRTREERVEKMATHARPTCPRPTWRRWERSTPSPPPGRPRPGSQSTGPRSGEGRSGRGSGGGSVRRSWRRERRLAELTRSGGPAALLPALGRGRVTLDAGLLGEPRARGRSARAVARSKMSTASSYSSGELCAASCSGFRRARACPWPNSSSSVARRGRLKNSSPSSRRRLSNALNAMR